MDVFVFGMVVIEVGSRALPHLVSEVEGSMVRLTSESRPRLLQESVRSVNSQPLLLLQRLWAVNARFVRRRREDKG